MPSIPSRTRLIGMAIGTVLLVAAGVFLFTYTPPEPEPRPEPEPSEPPAEVALDSVGAVAAMEPLMESALPAMESLSALLNLPRPETTGAPAGPAAPVRPEFRDRLRMHMYLQRLMLSILFHVPAWLPDNTAPEAAPVEPALPEQAPVYESGLGGAEKPGDYEFGRGHSRLNFR